MAVSLLTNIGLQTRMVGESRSSGSLKISGQLIHALSGRAIDDGRAVDVGLVEDALHAATLAGFHHRRERKIGPIESVDPHQRLAQFQIGDDFLLNSRSGGGREGRDGNVEEVLEPAQALVFGPEIVSPLRDAVRLVDRDIIRPAARPTRP